jgi:four helix bundle protein
MYYSQNPLLSKCFEFSLLAIKNVEYLEEHRKFVVAKQLLRCATAIGANSVEAQSAESKFDFIHKLKIADKEARETMYWLQLCEAADSYPNHSKLIPLLEEIMKLLNSIIKSARTTSTENS